jgi:cytochrome d ubiquinol oxidase subunit I
MRMEVTDFTQVLLNPVAQAKFVHTVSAGYVTGAMFVLSVSALYLLRGRHVEVASRSVAVAAAFGLASALSVVVLGDESGYTAGENQKMKIAAIEAMWDTEPAPASFTIVGLPDMATKTTRYAVRLPWALGLIATRSADEAVPGIKDLVETAASRIRSGMIAYEALVRLKQDRGDAAARERFDAHVDDLGYALLLKRFTPAVTDATEAQIAAAAQSTIPDVPKLFWSFRIMVGLGMWFIVLFATVFYLTWRRRIATSRRVLTAALWSWPLPWVAAELGWVVAEYGRQPWTIEGVLPTDLAVSSLPAASVAASLVGFVLFYTALLVADVYLMVKCIRGGPMGDLSVDQVPVPVAA